MLAALAAACAASVEDSYTSWSRQPTGPFSVTHKSYNVSALDESDRRVNVVFPTAEGRFPLVAYAHGFDDRGYVDYTDLFSDLASWGYVVVAPLSCRWGCVGDCKSQKHDPPCFGNYYLQQLKTIEWAQTSPDAKALPINRSAGVAIAGHSMGGQATLFSAAYNSSSYDIRAAAMHHAYTHEYPAAAVPFLAFTGELDDVAPPKMAESFYRTPGACSTRGLVNKLTATHHEPSTQYNPELGLATVGWFKIFVDGTPTFGGKDFEALLFGHGKDSLCHGGDGLLKECKLVRGTGSTPCD